MPLNDDLYARLNRRLAGGVRHIANPGVRARSVAYVDLATQRHSTRRVTSGEEYVCLCPFCDDKRGHLSINHEYGIYNDVTGSDNTHLANCYRRQCLKDPVNRAALRDKILGGLLSDVRRRLSPPTSTELATLVEPGTLIPVTPPGRIFSLTDLPPDYPAIAYLRGRGYDPLELASRWHVGFCSAPAHRMAAGRIYIPVMMDGVLVGWQARWPTELPKDSPIRKYYLLPGMPKRLVLYNYDLARTSPLVVLTEGPTDVWRVGPSGVALFGKTMSEQQEQLILKHWGTGVIIVLLDNDEPSAAAAAEKIHLRLAARASCPILDVRLPAGTDPGDHSREQLWEFIDRAAADCGMVLPPAPFARGLSSCPST